MTDNSMNMNVQADVSQAVSEFKDLERSLANVLTTAKGINQEFRRRMSRPLSGGGAGVSNISRTERGVLQSIAGGTQEQRLREAMIQRTLVGLRSSLNQGEARIANQMVQNYQRLQDNTVEQVEARLRNIRFRNTTRLADTTAGAIEARLSASQRRAQDRQARHQYGDLNVSNTRILDRIQSPGFMGVQAQIMANYAGVSAAFNGLRFMGRDMVALDGQMRQFQAITETTNAEMGKLEQRFIKVAQSTKFTAVEVAEAATIMGQAGLSARQVSDSIEAVTLLATASGSTLKESVDLVTSTLGIFNLQATETTHVANVMTSALNLSKLTMDKLVLGMQYAGNIAAQSGISYTELTSSLAGLANAGIRSGSTLGTGLRQLLIELMNPSQKLVAELGRLGISMDQIDVKSRGLTTVMQTLRDAGFGTANAISTMQIRAVAAFSAMSNNLDYIAKINDSLILSQAAAKANETQMLSLENTWKNFASTMSSVAYLGFKPVMSAIQSLLTQTIALASKLAEYPELLQLVATGFSGLIAAAVLVKIVRFSAWLLELPKLFAAVRTSAMGASAAITAVSAAGAAGGAVAGGAAAGAGLLGVIGRHPVLMLAGAIAVAVGAFTLFKRSNNDLSVQMDQTRRKIDEVRGSVEATNTSIDSIDGKIGMLIQRSAELERNPAMRRTTILELQAAYGQWGLKLDENATSVSQLIGAMQDLRAEMAQPLPEKLQRQLMELATLRRQQTDKTQEDLQLRPGNNLEAGLRRYAVAAMGARGSDISDPNLPARTAAALGLDREWGLATGAIRPQGAFEVEADVERARKRSLELEEEIKEAREAGNHAEVRRLERLRQVFDGIVEHLGKLSANTLEGARLKNEEDVTRREEVGARVRAENADLLAASDTLARDYTEEFARISASGFDATRMVEAYTALKERMSDDDARIEAAIKQRAVDYGQDSSAAEDILTNLASPKQLVEIKGQILSQLGEVDEEARKLSDKIYKQSQRVSRQMMSTLTARMRRQTTSEGVQRIAERIEEENANAKEALDAHHARVLRSYRDTVPDEIVEQIANEQDELDERIKNSAEIVRDKHVAVAEATARRLVSDLENQEARLLQEIAQFRFEISLGGPTALLQKITDAMNGKLNELDRVQMNLGTARIGAINSGGPSDAFMNALAGRESSNNYQSQNKFGYSGLLQFGAARLMDLGAYTPSAAEAIAVRNRTWGKTAGGQPFRWRGQFHIDQFPEVRSIQDFLNNPQAQDLINNRHFAKMADEIRSNGFDKYIGQTINGTRVTQSGLMGSLHLGGVGSTRKYLEGRGDNADLFGTSVGNYLRRFEGYSVDADATYQRTAREQQEEQNRRTKEISETRQREYRLRSMSSQREIDTLNQQIRAAEAEMSAVTTTPAELKELQAKVREYAQKIVDTTIADFDADPENARLLAAGDEVKIAERNALIESLKKDMDERVTKLQSGYLEKIEYEFNKPVRAMEDQIAAARRPENAGRTSDVQLQQMELELEQRRGIALQSTIQAYQQYQAQLAQTIAAKSQEAGSEAEVAMLREQQAQVVNRLNELLRENGVRQQEIAQPGVAQAIRDQTQAYLQQQGVLQASGELVPMAQRVGQAWGEILPNLTSSFSNLFSTLASGTVSAKDAFRQMGMSIIQTLMDVIAKALALQIITELFGDQTAGGKGGGLFSGGGFLGTLLGGLFGGGKIQGGPIRKAHGGKIPGNVTTRDSKMIFAQPGEYLLRQAAVNMIGEENLDRINAAGNIRVDQGVKALPAQDEQGGGGTVNVWVVSPDQVPPPGPRDIIATIAENISNRGQIRTLIKSVNTGAL